MSRRRLYMPKGYRVYLDDIVSSIDKIETYTKDITYNDFSRDSLISDAVIRNLEIIGEAVKKLPAEIKRKYPDIEWKKIAGLRDILIHEYFGIDLRIVWDIVENKIPELKSSVTLVLKEMK
jgi:uncharacterized protein with HEPN domain